MTSMRSASRSLRATCWLSAWKSACWNRSFTYQQRRRGRALCKKIGSVSLKNNIRSDRCDECSSLDRIRQTSRGCQPSPPLLSLCRRKCCIVPYLGRYTARKDRRYRSPFSRPRWVAGTDRRFLHLAPFSRRSLLSPACPGISLAEDHSGTKRRRCHLNDRSQARTSLSTRSRIGGEKATMDV